MGGSYRGPANIWRDLGLIFFYAVGLGIPLVYLLATEMGIEAREGVHRKRIHRKNSAERGIDRAAAESLVDEIQRHPGIIAPDREMCIGTLLAANIPSRSRFYEMLPYEKQEIKESDRTHYFSLRRILRNDGAMDYHNDWVRWAIEKAGAAVSWLGMYSSNDMVRRIRQDPELLRMMAESPHPFSLLCRMDTYGHSRPDYNLHARKPVLVIPGAKDIDRIVAWESANTKQWEC